MSSMLKIGRKLVGPGHPVYFIAEIGSNHDGSLEQAKKLIAAAAKAGADAVKFQSFTADGLYVPRKKDAGVWKENPVWKMFRGWELPSSWYAPLSACARENGVDFMSTPFEVAALKTLDEAGMPAIKIASGDMTHLSLIRAAAKTGKPVLVATGMADLAEVKNAYAAAGGAEGQVGLFHCVSLYPPKFEDMNVRAVATLAREFGCPVGLSDHTPGHEAVLGAVALGATMVEKHVTFDRTLKGPDHPYALQMDEFAAMVAAVRKLEMALGDGVKRPSANETGERVGARRGLYAARALKAGERLDESAVNAVRQCVGLGADQIDVVLGSTAARDIEKDEPLTWDNLTAAAAGKARAKASAGSGR